jgi:hypothetical protein
MDTLVGKLVHVWPAERLTTEELPFLAPGKVVFRTPIYVRYGDDGVRAYVFGKIDTYSIGSDVELLEERGHDSFGHYFTQAFYLDGKLRSNPRFLFQDNANTYI